MEFYKQYSGLIILLFVFYVIVIVYFKNTTENLEPIPQQQITVKQDTRYQYPLTPPVNPNVYRTELINSIHVTNDLYSNQTYDTNNKVLNDNPSGPTNQLDYSGGSCSLIKIPLQLNEPYNEQLRSQDILITPYNRIKYSTTADCF